MHAHAPAIETLHRVVSEESAANDAFVDADTLPDDDWGYGKLRAYEALYGEAPQEPPAFVERDLEVEFQAEPGVCTAIVRVSDVAWPSPSFRWDDDYDGEWDSAFVAAHERAIVVDPRERTYAVRVELGEAGWRVGGRAISGEAPASCFIEDEGGTTGGDDATGSNGGGDTTGGTGSDPSLPGGADETATGTDGDTGASASESGSAGCGCTAPVAPVGGWATAWALVVLARRRPRSSRGA